MGTFKGIPLWVLLLILSPLNAQLFDYGSDQVFDYNVDETIQQKEIINGNPITSINPTMYTTAAVKVINKAHNHKVCSTWGNFHYKNFDGDIFHFPGTCNYVYSSHCKSPYEDFNIQIQRTVNDKAPVIEKITMKLDGLVVQLDQNIVRVDGNVVQLPFSGSGVQIGKHGVILKITSKLGLVLMWNDDGSLLLELDEKYANQTCGLCGDFNGISINNEFIANGVQLTENQFGNLQKLDGPTEQCADVPLIPKSQCTDYEKICEEILLGSAFLSCRTLVDVQPYIETCVQDLCRCDSNITELCMCGTFAEYSRQCAHAGGQPKNWRTKDICPIKCPFTMEYQECGSPCANTCSNPERSVLCDDHCYEGCFCPQGTVYNDIDNSGCVPLDNCSCSFSVDTYAAGASYSTPCSTCVCAGGKWNCKNEPCPGTCSIQGGSHITTYDQTHYNIHGDCNYVLSKVCNGGAFTILSELRKCGLTDSETCLKSATIMINGGETIIVINPCGSVFVNNIYTQLPVSAANVTIFKPSSFYIVVHTNMGVQVVAQLTPFMQVYVILDPAFKSQTCGLCGNFNDKQSDDFETISGVIEGTAASFANTWKTQANCPNVKNVYEDPCSLSVENENYAKHWCGLLSDPSGPFSECHVQVNPEQYQKNCMFDTCNCEKSEECMCASVSSYVRACAAKGVILHGWRDIMCSKYMYTCPKTLNYTYSVDTCQPTCRSLSEHDVTCNIKFVPVDGCVCSKGYYLDDSGKCVPAAACPCYYKGTAVPSGEVVRENGVLCTCTQGKLSCIGSPEPVCVSPMVYFDCSNAKMDTKGSECQKSCQTLDMECYRTKCISGCVCPDGLVADGKGGCIKEEQCPCIHNDVAYQPGEKITLKCNTCTCKNRMWTCTNNPCLGTCAVYGDGHYITFDGKRYTFNGDCQYTLAQDHCSKPGNDDVGSTFRVITENVPCGTTGTTCSKAIKVYLGSFELILTDDHFEVLERGIGATVPYKVRHMGIFLVIEADNGLILMWDKRTSIFIKLSKDFEGKVCGLCGNYDGNGNNDFTTRSLSVVGDAYEFGNSWKFSPACPESTPNKDPCSANPYRKSWAQKQCSIINSKAFSTCHPQVDPSQYYDACVSDSCACDTGGDCECFCTAISAYAQTCGEAGVCVSWRTPTICPLFCDYYNPDGECEWHYKPCGAQCMKTCRNPTGKCLNEVLGLEGCYPSCPEDKPFFDEDEMKCVAQCGCYDAEGTHYPRGSKVYSKENCQSCLCTMAGIECQYSKEACTCDYNGKKYKYNEVIYDTPDTTGGCLSAVCKENGTIQRDTLCTATPSTTPFTFTTTPSTPHKETTKPNITTICIKEVCQWSRWFDVSYPSSDIDGGDFDTYQNIRAKGYSICNHPAELECRAERFPNTPLDELEQNVQCNNSFGLLCYNKDQEPPICYNYEIRIKCCSFAPCGTVITPEPTTTSTPHPKTTTTSPPTTSTTTTTTSTTLTTPTTTPTTTIPPTTTTIPIPITTTPKHSPTQCQPACKWTPWIDVHIPGVGKGEGDFETYEDIRAAGKKICSKPDGIQCRAEKYPEMPIGKTGQVVQCNVTIGLVCKNEDQEGDFKECLNYQVKVLCCDDYSYCSPTIPVSTTTTTTPTPYVEISTPTTSTTPFITHCYCYLDKAAYKPGELIYNKTDEVGCHFYAVCNEQCEAERFQGPCTTTTSPTTTSTIPAIPTTTYEGCHPDRKIHETWMINNCTKATCHGNNVVTIEDVKCPIVEKTTCANGFPPIKVASPDGCCHHYQCQCVCSGWGDPHYITFDGTYYTFLDNCTYVLVEQIIPKYDNFRVLIDNYFCDALDGLSCPQSIIIFYKSNEVLLTRRMYQGQMKNMVKFNQVWITPGFASDGIFVTSAGINMVVEIPEIDAYISFSGMIFVVKLPFSKFANNTQGQCGTCSNNGTEDCRLPTGEIIKDCSQMAHHWRVNTGNPYCNVKSTTPSPSPTIRPPPTTTCPPSSLCHLIKSEIFSECHKIISPDHYYEGCVFDACKTHTESLECSSIEMYATLCIASGICVDWRAKTGGHCPYTCPAGKVYDACGPVHPVTCDNNEISSSDGLTEGCYCPSGSRLFNAYSDICVTSCSACAGPEGNPVKAGETWLSNCNNCTCEANTLSVRCSPITCEEEPAEDCQLGYKQVTVQGSCCKSYACVPMPVCVAEDNIYQPGQEIPQLPGSCEQCNCTDEIDTKTLLNKVKCSTIQCNKDCQQGYQYKEISGQCCGICEQVACTMDIDDNTIIIQPGDTWQSPVNNCTYYECNKIKENYVVVTVTQYCTVLKPDECSPGYEYIKVAGECCGKCKQVECTMMKNDKSTVTFKPGDIWTPPDEICIHYECQIIDGKFVPTAVKTACPTVACALGYEYKERSGECCGTCEKVNCTVLMPDKTIKSLKPGETIISTEDKCTTYTCTLNKEVITNKDNCIINPCLEKNGTWMINNCTKAICHENNIITYEEVPCPVVEPVTCNNGFPPVKVYSADGCCFHYECQCVCSGWGDPHYITFDGIYYTFLENCTYVLVKQITPKYDNFHVLVDNYFCDALDGLSCPQSILIYYKNDEVVLTRMMYEGRMRNMVRFNQNWMTPGFTANGISVTSAGINMVVEIPEINAYISFSGMIFVVKLPFSKFAYNTEGQCGTCSNNKTEDCRLPSGEIIQDCSKMAHHWKVNVPGKPYCNVQPPTPTPTHPTIPPTCTPPSKSLCSLIKSEIFAECHDLIPPEPYYKGCAYDVCHINVSMECSSLEIYAALCAANGICVDWRARTEGHCPFSCPAGKVYDACGPLYPVTCDNKETPASKYLTEGCYCPSGSLLFNAYSNICVDSCSACVGPEGTPVKAGDSWLSNCKNCTCETNSLTVQCSPIVCTESPEECKLGYKQVTIHGTCCNSYTCERENVCVVQDVLYQPGQEIPQPPGSCEQCNCTDEIDAKTSLNLVKCRNIQCNKDCQLEGYQYKAINGQCCGTCEQVACTMKMGDTTVIIKPGETFTPPEDQCISYTCTSTYEVITLREGCSIPDEKKCLKPGDTYIPPENKCISYTCTSTYEVVTLKERCSITDKTQCLEGYEFNIKTEECCGECVKVDCIMTMNNGLTKILKPGETYIPPEDKCISYICKSNLEVETLKEKCAVTDQEQCPEGYEFKIKTGACCGECVKVDCIMTMNNNLTKILKPGETYIPPEDICIAYICKPNLEVETLKEKCAVTDQDQCPEGYEFKIKTGACCGECVKVDCIMTMNNLTKILKPGETYIPPEDKCISYICKPNLEVETLKEKCAVTDQEQCQEGYEFKIKTGACCGECVKVDCIMTMNNNLTKILKPGETYIPPEDKCISYMCKPNLEVETLKDKCAVTDQEQCKEGYEFKIKTGACCGECVKVDCIMTMNNGLPKILKPGETYIPPEDKCISYICKPTLEVETLKEKCAITDQEQCPEGYEFKIKTGACCGECVKVDCIMTMNNNLTKILKPGETYIPPEDKCIAFICKPNLEVETLKEKCAVTDQEQCPEGYGFNIKSGACCGECVKVDCIMTMNNGLPKILKPGETYIPPEDKCISYICKPNLEVETLKEKCAVNDQEQCPEGYKFKIKTGACCGECVKVDCIMTMNNLTKILKPGETYIPPEDKCISYICKPTLEIETLREKCAVTDQEQCQEGYEFMIKTGACCGECVKVDCIMTMNNNITKILKPGETYIPPEDKCISYICKPNLEVETLKEKCAVTDQEQCQEGYEFKIKTGACCGDCVKVDCIMTMNNNLTKILKPGETYIPPEDKCIAYTCKPNLEVETLKEKCAVTDQEQCLEGYEFKIKTGACCGECVKVDCIMTLNNGLTKILKPGETYIPPEDKCISYICKPTLEVETQKEKCAITDQDQCPEGYEFKIKTGACCGECVKVDCIMTMSNNLTKILKPGETYIPPEDKCISYICKPNLEVETLKEKCAVTDQEQCPEGYEFKIKTGACCGDCVKVDCIMTMNNSLTKILKPGETYIPPEDKCIAYTCKPNLEVETLKEKCAVTDQEQCQEGYEFKIKTGACCGECVKVDCIMTLNNGLTKILKPGETYIPPEDKCISYICKPTLEVETQKEKCAITDQDQCPEGYEFKIKTGACCGECVKVDCIMTMNNNLTKILKPGETYIPPEDKCISYICKPNLEVETLKEKCAVTDQDQCTEGYEFKIKTGACCGECVKVDCIMTMNNSLTKILKPGETYIPPEDKCISYICKQNLEVETLKEKCAVTDQEQCQEGYEFKIKTGACCGECVKVDCIMTMNNGLTKILKPGETYIPPEDICIAYTCKPNLEVETLKEKCAVTDQEQCLEGYEFKIKTGACCGECFKVDCIMTMNNSLTKILKPGETYIPPEDKCISYICKPTLEVETLKEKCAITDQEQCQEGYEFKIKTGACCGECVKVDCIMTMNNNLTKILKPGETYIPPEDICIAYTCKPNLEVETLKEKCAVTDQEQCQEGYEFKIKTGACCGECVKVDCIMTMNNNLTKILKPGETYIPPENKCISYICKLNLEVETLKEKCAVTDQEQCQEGYEFKIKTGACCGECVKVDCIMTMNNSLTKILKPGETYIPPEDKCISYICKPNLEVETLKEKCAVTDQEQCQEGYEFKIKTGACCGECVKVDCIMTMNNSLTKILKPGETYIPPEDKCISYTCKPNLEVETLKEKCAVTDQEQCQEGYEFKIKTGACCGECVKVDCIMTMNNGLTKILKPGETYIPPEDKCISYICKPTLEVETLKDKCAITDQEQCPEGYEFKIQTGACCGECVKVDCIMTMNNGLTKILKPGETYIPPEDKCISYTCKPTLEVETLKEKCAVTDQEQCPEGYEFKIKTGACCGECVKVDCIIPMNNNLTKILKPGETYIPLEDKCIAFICKPNLEVETLKEKCAVTDQEQCQEGYEFKIKTGACCGECVKVDCIMTMNNNLTKILKPGETYIPPEDKCIAYTCKPNLEVETLKEKCAVNDQEQCQEGYEFKIKTGACCGECVKVDCIMTLNNGLTKILKPGETYIPPEDKCISYICKPNLEVETLKDKCAITDQEQCQEGYEFNTKTGACCGECVKVDCIMTMNNNLTKILKPGETYIPPEDICIAYTCKPNLEVETLKEKCAVTDQEQCQEGYEFKIKTGACCGECVKVDCIMTMNNSQTKILKPGETYIPPEDKCIAYTCKPNLEVETLKEKCAVTDQEQCQEGYEFKIKTGACCGECVKVDCIMTMNNSLTKILKPGETYIPPEDKCISYICKPNLEIETLREKCAVTDQEQCQEGYEFKIKTGACCGECVKVDCIMTLNNGLTKILKPGETYIPPEDKCISYICKPNLEVETLKDKCAVTDQEQCQEGYEFKIKTGACCGECVKVDCIMTMNNNLTKILKPGETYIPPEDKCIAYTCKPNLEVETLKEKCAVTDQEQCQEAYEFKIKTGACCGECVKVDCIMTMNNNITKILKPGETYIPPEDKCISYICKPNLEVETLKEKCAVTDQEQCQEGYEFKIKTGACCGECVKVDCIMTMNNGLTKILKPGETYIPPEDKCISYICKPNLEVETLKEKCAVTDQEQCQEGYEFKIKTGACCGECVKVDCIMTMNNSLTKILKPGETYIPPEDKCISYICKPNLEVETLKEKCAVTDQEQCQEGYEFKIKTGACCGECVKVDCIMTTNNGLTKILKPGETFTPEEDKCISYTCTSSYEVITVKETCPAFDPAHCLEGTIKLSENGCCKTCEAAESGCKLQKQSTRIRTSTCESDQAVELSYCEGACTTTSMYSPEANTMEHKCSCCQEMKTSQKEVELKCLDGTSSLYSYIYVEECGCTSTKCDSMPQQSQSKTKQ